MHPLFRAIAAANRHSGPALVALGMFGGGSQKPPSPPPPVPMPDLADPAILAAQKKRLLDASARSGRASTLLSTDDYSSTKLGTS